MERSCNNCDVLRMTSALLVIASHAFMLTTGNNITEPMFAFSNGQVTCGGIGVFTFFVVSGYLITGAYKRAAGVWSFLVARALRIGPALAVVLVVTALGIGPLISDLPVSAYFHTAEPFRYVALNLSLLRYTDRLPGVLQNVPFAGSINGSLWTLHIEAACYGLVVLLGSFGLLGRGGLAVLFGLGLVAIAVLTPVTYPVVLATLFLAGAVLHQWRPALNGWLAILCTAVLGIALLHGSFLLAFATAGAYVAIYLGFSPALPALKPTGTVDLSYGMYIWAFPVQQVVLQTAGGKMAWYTNLLISLPIVVGLALASWYFVEAPSLRWKRRLAGRALMRLSPIRVHDTGLEPLRSPEIPSG